jgi:hypothetical protein
MWNIDGKAVRDWGMGMGADCMCDRCWMPLRLLVEAWVASRWWDIAGSNHIFSHNSRTT